MIRISGPDALLILKSVFLPFNKEEAFRPRYMALGNVTDEKGRAIDKALAVYFPSPNSYTGEDVCEIQCHGGATVTRMILELLLKNGAVMAEPGEFTKRAFLNGKMDLAEAEGVMELISAMSEKSARAAALVMEGGLSKKVTALQHDLEGVIAGIEAGIEYPDEDIEVAGRGETELKKVASAARKLLDTGGRGRVLREGIRVAIIGTPNVGKSSILNSILGSDRAIVTKVPGTTRDIIEEQYTFDGLPVVFIDTAGIRETSDAVEEIGVKRSLGELDKSAVVMQILDGTRSVEPREQEIFEKVRNRPHVLVLNKSDRLRDEDVPEEIWGEKPLVISARTGEGMDGLLEAIKNIAIGQSDASDGLAVMTARHADAFRRACDAMDSALRAFSDGADLDCVSIDLMDAYHALGEITGRSVTEDIIDRIFSEFCLGK